LHGLVVRPRRLAAQDIDQLGEVRDETNPAERHHEGLGGACDRHHDVAFAECSDHRGDAVDRAERSVEAEFADECDPLDRLGRDHAAGCQHADGDRQVESRPRLAITRRRQVDGDLVFRPGGAAAEHGGAGAVS
jgi:hypothetical protein